MLSYVVALRGTLSRRIRWRYSWHLGWPSWAATSCCRPAASAGRRWGALVMHRAGVPTAIAAPRSAALFLLTSATSFAAIVLAGTATGLGLLPGDACVGGLAAAGGDRGGRHRRRSRRSRGCRWARRERRPDASRAGAAGWPACCVTASSRAPPSCAPAIRSSSAAASATCLLDRRPGRRLRRPSAAGGRRRRVRPRLHPRTGGIADPHPRRGRRHGGRADRHVRPLRRPGGARRGRGSRLPRLPARPAGHLRPRRLPGDPPSAAQRGGDRRASSRSSRPRSAWPMR